jgi:DNA-directed RNA polymerase subunit RPC12/RpoP
MSNQLRKPRGFGVGDKPRCLNCGKPTSLTRRAPAAESVLEYEQQTFTCFDCEREFTRVVDSKGRRVRAQAAG